MTVVAVVYEFHHPRVFVGAFGVVEDSCAIEFHEGFQAAQVIGVRVGRQHEIKEWRLRFGIDTLGEEMAPYVPLRRAPVFFAVDHGEGPFLLLFVFEKDRFPPAHVDKGNAQFAHPRLLLRGCFQTPSF